MFCNALCCQLRASQLQAYAMVAKGLFFRIPSLRSECYNLIKRDLIIHVLLAPFFHIDEKTKMYFLKDINNMSSGKFFSKKLFLRSDQKLDQRTQDNLR